MKVDSVIWQFSSDYPAGGGVDQSLPIDSVYVKTHDGTSWMSAFDSHPASISGPLKLQHVVKNIYTPQGIGVFGWCVPKGEDIAGQVIMAQQVVRTPGVRGLFFDVEPYAGFCDDKCEPAAAVIRELRRTDPQAFLGVIYDPRPQHYSRSALGPWLQHADAAAPMCYWNDFRGQPGFDNPDGCVSIAHDLLRGQLAFPRAFMPMLPGNVPPTEMTQAVSACLAKRANRISIWRRGTVQPDTWTAISGFMNVEIDLAQRLDACGKRLSEVTSIAETRSEMLGDLQSELAAVQGENANLRLALDGRDLVIANLQRELADRSKAEDIVGRLQLLNREIGSWGK